MYEDSEMLSWSPQKAFDPAPVRYQLVAVDLDSILQSDGTLHPVDTASMRTAHSIGAKVVLVSARPPQAMHRFWAQLGLGTPVIALNGALVYDFPSHKEVVGQPIDAGALQNLLQIVQRVAPRAAVGLERGETWVTNRLGPAGQLLIKQTGVWPAKVGDVRAALKEPVYQVWLDVAPLEPDSVQTELAGAGLTVTRGTQPDLIYLRSPAATRGWALSSLASLLEIESHAVMAVGAGGRDRSMLQAAAFTVFVTDISREAEAANPDQGQVARTQGLAEAFARYLAAEGSDTTLWPSTEP